MTKAPDGSIRGLRRLPTTGGISHGRRPMKRRYVTDPDVAVLDHPIFITAPRREKVECSVCGRQGYPGERWQEYCRMGHHSCADCGMVMAYTKTGKPRRIHRGCPGVTSG